MKSGRAWMACCMADCRSVASWLLALYCLKFHPSSFDAALICEPKPTHWGVAHAMNAIDFPFGIGFPIGWSMPSDGVWTSLASAASAFLTPSLAEDDAELVVVCPEALDPLELLS